MHVDMSMGWRILAIVGVLATMLVVTCVYLTDGQWFKALFSGRLVNPFRILWVRLKGGDPRLLLEAKSQVKKAGIRSSIADLTRLVTSLRSEQSRSVLDAASAASGAGIPVSLPWLQDAARSGLDVTRFMAAAVMMRQAGQEVELDRLAAHQKAGGDIEAVAGAVVKARSVGISLSFERAAAMQLSGRDMTEILRMSVTPESRELPEPVTAMAGDGVEVTVRARVTMQLNLDRVVGGADETTVFARARQAISAAIAATDSHRKVLENPELISQVARKASLSKDTAFFVTSVDITEIRPGENVGARMRAEKAEADLRAAQAEIARQEQELRIRRMELEARRLEDAARVSQALARDYEQGRIDAAQYERLRNADVSTRSAAPSEPENPALREIYQPPRLDLM